MIYLDHNATTPLHPRAFEAMLPFLKELWANPSSPYRFGSQAKAAVELGRGQIANCIGCKPSEVVFCSGGTESDNLALRGVVRALKSKGNHIVTTAIEHPAVLNTCKALENEGYRVTYLPVTEEGVVEMAALRASLCDGTILVTVMHANNETGVIQPVEEIATTTRARGVVFHTDAVQSAGKLDRKLAELGADLVTFSGHKLYGPRGVGVLYVREGTPLAPWMTGGTHEHGLRAGTENVAAIAGCAEAVTLAFEEAETEGHRLRSLRDRFELQVGAAIQAVRFNGSEAQRVPNTSNISFQDVDGESVVLGLDVRGICVSTGSACSTDDPEPSHVLRAMGLSPRAAQGSVRFSLGRDTCAADLDATVSALKDTVAHLRRVSSIRGDLE